MPERRYICEACRGEFVTNGRSGPVPKKCDSCCDKRQASQRRIRRGERRYFPAEEVHTLRAQAALATAEIRRRKATMAERGRSNDPRAILFPSEEAIFDEVETRARQFGPPGIDAVKRCLIRLRHAEGSHGTADAAEDLARALIVWARVLRLTASGRIESEHPDSVARRERARAA
jgi:hypothetical protein